MSDPDLELALALSRQSYEEETRRRQGSWAAPAAALPRDGRNTTASIPYGTYTTLPPPQNGSHSAVRGPQPPAQTHASFGPTATTPGLYPGAAHPFTGKMTSSYPTGPLPLAQPQKQDSKGSGSSKGQVCAGCGRLLGFGTYIRALNQFWHEGCLRCVGCNKPLGGEHVAMRDGDPYHVKCAQELFVPKCVLCDRFIEGQGSRVLYNVHSFFKDEVWCPRHSSENRRKCFSCDRYERDSQRGTFIELSDRRSLCPTCASTAMFDTSDARPLIDRVMRFLQSKGITPVPAGRPVPPIVLVDAPTLNDQGPQAGRSHTRGLCLAEQGYITRIFRSPYGGTSTERVFMERTADVTAILILYGLPELLTGAILAHELLHAYFKLRPDCQRLTPTVEEGVCNLASFMWLDSFRDGGTKLSDRDEALRRYWVHQYETDPSPEYGEGFRQAVESSLKFGFEAVVSHVAQTGCFP